MVEDTQPDIRSATADDAPAVAALHADSWRRHYRGIYADDYLDGDLAADRAAVWSQRLVRPSAPTVTLLAEDAGELVGFDEAHGARCVDSRLSTPPGGVAGRLHGAPVALRYAWSDPRDLLSHR